MTDSELLELLCLAANVADEEWRGATLWHDGWGYSVGPGGRVQKALERFAAFIAAANPETVAKLCREVMLCRD